MDLIWENSYGATSVDAGKNWAQLKDGFPPVPVYDVQIHPRDGDAIVATHWGGAGSRLAERAGPIHKA